MGRLRTTVLSRPDDQSFPEYRKPASPEQVSHVVWHCEAVRREWAAVGKVLKWQYLRQQDWETVVSGLKPEKGYGNPRERWPWVFVEHRSLGFEKLRRRRRVPWSIVRLIDLIMIHII